MELLRSIDPQTTEFINLRAWGTHNLAALVRELYLPDAVAEIERQLGGVPWPADFDHNRFQALKALAWAKAMQGDYFNAFRHLKAASEAADTTAWKVVAGCDRAYLARAFGEHRWSRVELDEAEQLANGVDWHATLNEERIGLLLLAELFSEIDTARAAMYLAKYRELGEVKSPLFFRRDARRNAFAAILDRRRRTGPRQQEARLSRASRSTQGLRALRLRFSRRAVSGGRVRSHRRSRAASGYRGEAPQLSAELADDAATRATGSARGSASRCSGKCSPGSAPSKSTAEISHALGRNEYTISNHIKQIFKTFEVRSRSALVAEAVRRRYGKDRLIPVLASKG